ncbi:NUDIX hydrolase [Candidatus Fermentibacteria bacterium]|nr:MAG: NUDIX hydrolase [Candidatus Fermentibacteria bacterium]PIE53367.1 MAG: NUDIX hydrolase [Candidatus Fermentibacteria bacterium]
MTQKKIRTSAKAIIIQDEKLLAIRNFSSGQNWYILPGGGQEHGESLTDTLIRECREEASIGISAGDIIFIRDYIALNHQFAEEDGDIHQVEFMFKVEITDGTPSTGSHPDIFQKGVEWLPLKDLDNYALYPSALKKLLKHGLPENEPVYLGDVN